LEEVAEFVQIGNTRNERLNLIGQSKKLQQL